jgi:hypothetical protein
MAKCSNPFLNRSFHTIFYSVLYIVTSPLLQLLLYQVIKFHSPWFGLGLFHLLVVLYFPSMLIAAAVVLIQVYQNYHSFQRSPFFLSFGQLFVLAALTVAQVVCDYLSLTLNTTVDIQRQTSQGAGQVSLIHWDLVRFLILQMMVQMVVTPVLNKFVMRNKI